MIAEPLVAGAGEVLPWEELVERLRTAELFWLTTTGADGGPHTRPVLAVVVDGTLFTTTSPTSRKGRNLARDPRCSVAVREAGLDVVVEGVARRVREGAVLERVAEAFGSTKYGWAVEIRDQAFWAEGAPTAGPPPFHVLRLEPTAAYGFGTTEALMARSTRWRP